jgi:hypothetical protein
MMSESEEKRVQEPESKLTVHVRQPESVPVFYIHGAWGGIGPRGEIVAYLYQDTQKFPSEFDVIITREGAAVGDQSSEPVSIERVPVAKLLIPVNVAHSLAHWLEGQAEAWAKLASGSVVRKESETES